MLYQAGDSQHTQNIQIDEVIDKNEKCVFYFWKKKYGLFGQPSTLHMICLRDAFIVFVIFISSQVDIINWLCEINIYFRVKQ